MEIEGRVLTIVGGKLTTYHAMAEKALRLVLKTLGKTAPLPDGKLPGQPGTPWESFMRDETSDWVSRYKITADQAAHLAALYGARAGRVLELSEKTGDGLEPLAPGRPEIKAQVVFAVAEEKALHLGDVLLRRLEIGTSGQRWGEASEKASRWMADALGWDEPTRLKELKLYREALYPPVH